MTTTASGSGARLHLLTRGRQRGHDLHWEWDKKRPTPLYREMLGLVFDTEAHDLGFGGPALAGSAASLPGHLGAAGSLLQSRCSMYGRTSSCSAVRC